MVSILSLIPAEKCQTLKCFGKFVENLWVKQTKRCALIRFLFMHRIQIIRMVWKHTNVGDGYRREYSRCVEPTSVECLHWRVVAVSRSPLVSKCNVGLPPLQTPLAGNQDHGHAFPVNEDLLSRKTVPAFYEWWGALACSWQRVQNPTDRWATSLSFSSFFVSVVYRPHVDWPKACGNNLCLPITRPVKPLHFCGLASAVSPNRFMLNTKLCNFVISNILLPIGERFVTRVESVFWCLWFVTHCLPYGSRK